MNVESSNLVDKIVAIPSLQSTNRTWLRHVTLFSARCM